MCTSCTEIERKSGKKDFYCCDVYYEAEDAAREEVLYKQNLQQNAKEPTAKPPVQESQFIMLCLHGNEVVNCDTGNSTDHACLGYKGPTKCENLEDAVNNSMCADVST